MGPRCVAGFFFHKASPYVFLVCMKHAIISKGVPRPLPGFVRSPDLLSKGCPATVLVQKVLFYRGSVCRTRLRLKYSLLAWSHAKRKRCYSPSVGIQTKTSSLEFVFRMDHAIISKGVPRPLPGFAWSHAIRSKGTGLQSPAPPLLKSPPALYRFDFRTAFSGLRKLSL